MSKKPPGAGDPLLQEILRQIKDSFVDTDQNPFVDSELFDMLSQELSSSIEALTKQGLSESRPDISVVEGGLPHSEENEVALDKDNDLQKSNPSIQEVPQLHIANPTDYASDILGTQEEDSLDKANGSKGVFSSLFGVDSSNVEVRVFGPEDLEKLRAELSSKQQDEAGDPAENIDQPVGLILLGPEEKQLIFNGHQPQIYRICAGEGKLIVSDGDKELTRLKAGQSCDVEGKILYVQALDVKAEGWYNCVV